MHILIIPSEEFVPAYNKLEGIFQYHQAVILKEAGYKTGALSVRLSFSLPMVVKASMLKIIGKKANNTADRYSLSGLLKLGFQKIFFPKKFVSHEIIDGIIVTRIDGLYKKKPAPNQNYKSWVAAGLIGYKEYVQSNGKPDLIHAHDAIYAGMLAEAINSKFLIPYIITEHSSFYALNKLDAQTMNMVNKAHHKAAGLYAVSEAFAGLLNRSFTGRQFRYLPNVLDQFLEKNSVADAVILKPVSDKFIFLHVAVFKPVKDQVTLLKAFKQLVQKNASAELWIGGTGELKDTLHQLATELQLQGAVRFLGLLSRDQVIGYMKQSNCFVLSSKYETFGVVTIEAMLFGKPVIVTRCGVAQDIVDETNGILVEAGNAEELTAAMLQMMTSPKVFDGRQIRQTIINNFGKESFLKRINKVYSEAV